MNKATKCEGKRRGFHRGTFGEFKCTRNAKGTVTTNVGISRTHYCCGDDQCYGSIACGYPAEFIPFKKK